jgi:peptide-methionine (R)-S-oxide reductase
MSNVDKSKLKELLTPLQYHVTQEGGTERPFTGKYNKFYEKGSYVCVVCKQNLFSSDTKYDSGLVKIENIFPNILFDSFRVFFLSCGWPAFNDVLEKGKITLHNDPSLG